MTADGSRSGTKITKVTKTTKNTLEFFVIFVCFVIFVTERFAVARDSDD